MAPESQALSGFDLLLDEMAPEFSGLVQNPPLHAEVVRELSVEDLAVLETTVVGSKPSPLKRVRYIHHQTARLLASGMKAVEVSSVTGLCQSRISILLSDPTFKDLVTFYAERDDARLAAVQDRLVSLGIDAAAELHSRIVESPDLMSSKDLTSVMVSALDRGGHSPVHKSESVSATISAEDLARIKTDVLAEQTGKIIDVTAEEIADAEEIEVSKDTEPEVGTAIANRPLHAIEGSKAEEQSSEGTGI